MELTSPGPNDTVRDLYRVMVESFHVFSETSNPDAYKQYLEYRAAYERRAKKIIRMLLEQGYQFVVGYSELRNDPFLERAQYHILAQAYTTSSTGWWARYPDERYCKPHPLRGTVRIGLTPTCPTCLERAEKLVGLA